MFIEHVNLTVTSVDRSAEFYCELLDLKIRWKGKTSGGMNAAHVGDERSYIALFEAERGGRIEKDYGEVGLNHFGLVVDDLDGMKQRLGALGLKHHSEQDYDPGRRIYFMDPDGIEVELVEYETVPGAGAP